MHSQGRGTCGRGAAARALICAGLLGAVAFLRAGRAEAAPVAFSLTWDAPSQCPDADYLRVQVETLLAGAPPTLVRVVARAAVLQRDDGMWTVRLTTDRDGILGERSLEADACRCVGRFGADAGDAAASVYYENDVLLLQAADGGSPVDGAALEGTFPCYAGMAPP